MSANIDREENQTDMVLVPRCATKQMIEAAWADATAEDAEGVWNRMIEEWVSSQKRKFAER